MANAIKQFRYYGDGNVEKNQPQDAELAHYRDGRVFNDYLPILQLGIQALPGTMFYLNNAEDPIRVGRTGYYELDLQGETEIFNLTFDDISLQLINDNEKQAYLIIDIVYDNREA